MLGGLAACAKSPAVDLPTFQIGEQNFTYMLPNGFCHASEDWKRSFSSIAAQNADKRFLGQLVDCVENARLANSPNYILIMTVTEDYKPNMDPKQFAALLHSNKTFDDLKRAVAGMPENPVGEEGYLFPEVNDEHCLFSGGYYGQPPLTPENRGSVINCTASVAGHQIIIMYNGDGKQDVLEMARKVSRLVGSMEMQAE
jgi:hypothetical protein